MDRYKFGTRFFEVMVEIHGAVVEGDQKRGLGRIATVYKFIEQYTVDQGDMYVAALATHMPDPDRYAAEHRGRRSAGGGVRRLDGAPLVGAADGRGGGGLQAHAQASTLYHLSDFPSHRLIVWSRYSYWRSAPPTRDWTVEPGFDPRTCYCTPIRFSSSRARELHVNVAQRCFAQTAGTMSRVTWRTPSRG